MKVLVIGHSSWDISCPVDEYPVENTKYRLDESVMCGGGPAGNAAFLLAKWGIETYYAGVVGSDDFGTKIKKEFEHVGVHTDYLETNYEKPTSLSFIMINRKNGSRTLFNIANGRPSMKKSEFTCDPDVILIDGHEYNASISAINKYPNAISIIDAGRITSELLELCKNCKYIVASKGFAETVTKMKIDFANPGSLVQVYTALKNRYNHAEIVVTLEDRGALYAVNNEIKIMPGLKVDAVDTTGAGDIFHGAFTYAIAKGFDIEKAVRYSNITAGLSVGKLGARMSIPTLVEVNNYYNEKFPNQATPNQQVNPNAAQVTPQVQINQQVTPAAPVAPQPQVVQTPVAPVIPEVPVQPVQQVQVESPINNVTPVVPEATPTTSDFSIGIPTVGEPSSVNAQATPQATMSYAEAMQNLNNNQDNNING